MLQNRLLYGSCWQLARLLTSFLLPSRQQLFSFLRFFSLLFLFPNSNLPLLHQPETSNNRSKYYHRHHYYLIDIATWKPLQSSIEPTCPAKSLPLYTKKEDEETPPESLEGASKVSRVTRTIQQPALVFIRASHSVLEGLFKCHLVVSMSSFSLFTRTHQSLSKLYRVEQV